MLKKSKMILPIFPFKRYENFFPFAISKAEKRFFILLNLAGYEVKFEILPGGHYRYYEQEGKGVNVIIEQESNKKWMARMMKKYGIRAAQCCQICMRQRNGECKKHDNLPVMIAWVCSFFVPDEKKVAEVMEGRR